MPSCRSQSDTASQLRRLSSLALGGALLLTGVAACNALWGVDDLSYTNGGAAGAAGAVGTGTTTTTTSCEAQCAGTCAGADDGCGGVCDEQSCAGADCCDLRLACVAGQEDTQCGAAGASCVDCTATDRTCGPTGTSFAAQTSGCLPPCAGHLRFISISTGDLGGAEGASAQCALAAGAAWRLVTEIDQAREPWQAGTVQWTGGPIVGLCDGDWCTDVDWGAGTTVLSVLSASSCSGLSATAAGLSADGIQRNSNGCGQWESDAGGVDCSLLQGNFAFGTPGILCTDL